MKFKLEAVIFDMDGLMLDTERLAMESMKVAGKVVGLNLTDEILMGMIGLNENDSNDFLEKRFCQSINRKKLSEAFYEDYHALIAKDGIAHKAGLIELINYLKEKNIRLAVATSTKTELALKKLKLAGIINHFEVIIGGDLVAHAKPAPDSYLKAAERLKVDVANCVALEDSDNGAMAAFRAGIKVIVVPDIKRPSDNTKKIASKICNSLVEVKLILEEFINRPAVILSASDDLHRPSS